MMTTKYIALPGELLDKVKAAAAEEEITAEDLVRDAIEQRLRRAEWTKTLLFGDHNAQQRGLRPEDVGIEISAARSERVR